MIAGETGMTRPTSDGIHRVTLLVLLTAGVFALFFQTAKSEPWRSVNPFLEDPYDAVGSFAVQGALLLGILNYARVLRLRRDASQRRKSRLVLRGDALALAAAGVTVVADTSGALSNPMPGSTVQRWLLLGLGMLALLTAACILALWRVARRAATEQPPNDLTPADGIDDLLELPRTLVAWLARFLQRSAPGWIEAWNSDRLFTHLPWIDPRRHPWRFAVALGLLAGLSLMLAQLSEGLPPSLSAALLLTAIFIGAETAAILAGFAALGGFLGLRPT